MTIQKSTKPAGGNKTFMTAALLSYTAFLGLTALSSGLNTVRLSALDDVSVEPAEGGVTVTRFGEPHDNGRPKMKVTRYAETVTTGKNPRFAQGDITTTYIFGLPVSREFKPLQDIGAANLGDLSDYVYNNGQFTDAPAALQPVHDHMQVYNDIENGLNTGVALAMHQEKLQETQAALRQFNITALRAEYESESALGRADATRLLGIPESRINYKIVTHQDRIEDGTRRVRRGDDCRMSVSAVGYNGKPGMRRSCSPKYVTETVYTTVPRQEKILPQGLQKRLDAAQKPHKDRARELHREIARYSELVEDRGRHLNAIDTYTQRQIFLEQNGGSLQDAWEKGQTMFASAVEATARGWQAEIKHNVRK